MGSSHTRAVSGPGHGDRGERGEARDASAEASARLFSAGSVALRMPGWPIPARHRSRVSCRTGGGGRTRMCKGALRLRRTRRIPTTGTSNSNSRAGRSRPGGRSRRCGRRSRADAGRPRPEPGRGGCSRRSGRIRTAYHQQLRGQLSQLRPSGPARCSAQALTVSSGSGQSFLAMSSWQRVRKSGKRSATWPRTRT